MNTTLDVLGKGTVKHEKTLFHIVNLIALNQKSLAQSVLNRLLDKLNTDECSSAVNYLVFARALAERISGSVAAKANLYLKTYDLPQIHLFNLLVRDVPVISAVSQLATNLLADACQKQDDITLIDVGIGTGRQVVDLLAKLGSHKIVPKRILVVGIEPSAWSLDLAKQNCEKAAAQIGIDIEFISICKAVEDLTEHEWDHLKQVCHNPTINASFALHHIKDIEGRNVRTLVLQRLRSLNPNLLVLSEPNVNHLEQDFLKRFCNCWHHFGIVFKLIDSLDISQCDKNALKACFFGREIIDILAVNENRTERHEDTSSWLHRLRNSGFKVTTPQPVYDLLNFSQVKLTLTSDYFSFDYDGEPIESVLVAAS
ncbi:GRAS family protein [Mastigocoleus testarum]|uniref:Uncharacterized protein n=1 Tax=Mastigocoleus testarum BC008 TaxID=371196 RepID=A0A0V7ZV74_9CYAN|nr:GRAS family protein [Mastigocoleus testarum]KST68086.1 hypothetical protein BC008_00120 [Mastigocoleus testarum BC008]